MRTKQKPQAKQVAVTLVSEDLPIGCGFSTYYGHLFKGLQKKKVRISSRELRKFLDNYPISLSSIPKTKIVHFTDQKAVSVLFFSLFRKYKSVVTVHDVIELINFKNVYQINSIRKKISHFLWSRIIKRSLCKADEIIAVSNHTKKDIQKLLGPQKNISVIYEAADNTFKPRKIKRQNSVLYVGSALSHKNLPVLLKAFALVQKKIPTAKLVLIGRSLAKNKSVQKLVRDLKLQKNIVFKGYVKDTASEYAKAGVLVFPSLYEGFGLPVLEAMACGCPVICSNRASLPEVGGSAAIYFNGIDVPDLAQKITKVLTTSALQKKMGKQGVAQANKFSWEKCAEQTKAIYIKVLMD